MNTEREQTRILQITRCRDLLQEASDYMARAAAANAQATAIAKSWEIDLDKLAKSE